MRRSFKKGNEFMFNLRSWMLMVPLCVAIPVVVGCGGDSTPVPITDEIAEDIERHDQEVLDEESEL